MDIYMHTDVKEEATFTAKHVWKNLKKIKLYSIIQMTKMKRITGNSASLFLKNGISPLSERRSILMLPIVLLDGMTL